MPKLTEEANLDKLAQSIVDKLLDELDDMQLIHLDLDEDDKKHVMGVLNKAVREELEVLFLGEE